MATVGETIRRKTPDIVTVIVVAYRSFALKLVVLIAVFIAVPVILYGQFRAADEVKNSLLLRTVQEQGRLIAKSVAPKLSSFDGRSATELSAELNRLAGPTVRSKLLFRPKSAPRSSFYYVASAPAVSPEYLETERGELFENGLFDRIPDSCGVEQPLADRFKNPAGEVEVLTSITPTTTEQGCWVVITSSSTSDVLSSSIGQAYWQTPEIQWAATIYFAMALIVILLFYIVRRSLVRFERLARNIRERGDAGTSFASLSNVPELTPVAREFDRMVDRLKQSAELIRHAAEENAHAFKSPLGVIAQSVEPLKKSPLVREERIRRAIELIEQSVLKLDNLVTAARQMDQTTAAFVDPPREAIPLRPLLEGLCAGYQLTLQDRGIRLITDLRGDPVILAGEDLLEVVFENLFDNAASFSPSGATIRVSLSTDPGRARVVVEDEGPGVAEKDLPLIFGRYYSNRPATVDAGGETAPPGKYQGFGIGLSIVARNVEAIGGTVVASNREARGLKIVLTLPIRLPG